MEYRTCKGCTICSCNRDSNVIKKFSKILLSALSLEVLKLQKYNYGHCLVCAVACPLPLSIYMVDEDTSYICRCCDSSQAFMAVHIYMNG